MADTLSTTLAALADPTRREIVGILARGPANVSEFVERFDLAQPTISKHVKVLEAAGLVSRSRIGKTRPCELNPKMMMQLEAWLLNRRSEWESRLDRYEAHLQRMKQETRNDE